MICYVDIWSKKIEFYFFFQNCLAMLGICLGIITGHFESIKKLKKMKILCFSKDVYWPLGYYLASSLIIFSPEINIFENLEKHFSKNVFFHIYFYFLVYLRINNPKNCRKIASKRINILNKGPYLKGPEGARSEAPRCPLGP